MYVTAQEEYGLRCMLQLARAQIASDGKDSYLSAVEIARAEGISVPYANKLMHIAKKAGIVRSLRGLKGGYQLNRDANQLTVLEALKAMNGFILIPGLCDCYQGHNDECVHYRDSCSIRSVWAVLAEHIGGVLSEATLAELATNKELFMANRMRLKFQKQVSHLTEAHAHV